MPIGPGAAEISPLVIVCDWLPPEFGAVGQYSKKRAELEARRGRDVTLIGLGGAASKHRETIGDGGLTTIRIARSKPNKASLLQRAMWAISTDLALVRELCAAARDKGTIEIQVTGSPPFLSYLILFLSEFTRHWRVTYRITDFYPETAIVAGKASWLAALAPIFHALRRRAHHLEALSECQTQRLLQCGVDLTKVSIVRDGSPVEFRADTQPAPRPFAADDVVLLYSGNLGVAHDWRGFGEAYRRHVQSGTNRVRLWLNATGTRVDELIAFCRRHDLPVHHMPPSTLEALPNVLAAADAHLILLGDAFWGYVVPSKVYACLASGKPCFYIGPAESDLHALIAPETRNASLRNHAIGEIERALDALVRAKPTPAASPAAIN